MSWLLSLFKFAIDSEQVVKGQKEKRKPGRLRHAAIDNGEKKENFLEHIHILIHVRPSWSAHKTEGRQVIITLPFTTFVGRQCYFNGYFNLQGKFLVLFENSLSFRCDPGMKISQTQQQYLIR